MSHTLRLTAVARCECHNPVWACGETAEFSIGVDGEAIDADSLEEFRDQANVYFRKLGWKNNDKCCPDCSK